jgi:hypothetical protein
MSRRRQILTGAAVMMLGAMAALPSASAQPARTQSGVASAATGGVTSPLSARGRAHPAATGQPFGTVRTAATAGVIVAVDGPLPSPSLNWSYDHYFPSTGVKVKAGETVDFQWNASQPNGLHTVTWAAAGEVAYRAANPLLVADNGVGEPATPDELRDPEHRPEHRFLRDDRSRGDDVAVLHLLLPGPQEHVGDLLRRDSRIRNHPGPVHHPGRR